MNSHDGARAVQVPFLSDISRLRAEIFLVLYGTSALRIHGGTVRLSSCVEEHPPLTYTTTRDCRRVVQMQLLIIADHQR